MGGALPGASAMTVQLVLVLTGLGFVGAFVSGLIGVGGAIILIPLLYYVPPMLDVGALDIRAVSAVTMVQVLAASLVGAWTHGGRSAVDRRLAWTGGAAMAAGSLLGAVGSRYVSSRALLAVFGVMTALALPLMLVQPARAEETARPVPFALAPAIALPALIGTMSGLVGAGGAFLIVPVLVALIRVPVRLAIGTSLAMTSMSAFTGVLGKVVTGQVPAGPTAAVVIGALAGARMGAQLSPRAPVAVLRGVLVVLVMVVAVRVWYEVLVH